MATDATDRIAAHAHEAHVAAAIQMTMSIDTEAADKMIQLNEVRADTAAALEMVIAIETVIAAGTVENGIVIRDRRGARPVTRGDLTDVRRHRIGAILPGLIMAVIAEMTTKTIAEKWTTADPEMNDGRAT